jgi:hypothetical protein
MFRTSAAFFGTLLTALPAVPILPASAAMAERNPAIAQCRDLLPSRPQSNAGECRSWITVAGNESDGEVSHHCDALEENDPIIFDMMFTSKHDCIQAFGGRGHFN